MQRPLWASTSTKNPAYPDTLYVDTLIGPDTVNTMPEATIDATRDHGVAARTIDVKVDAAAAHMAELERIGVDLDRILVHELVDEGVESFTKSFDSLIATIDDEGARARTGARMSMAAEVARLFARDASLWTDSGEDAWLGWIDAVEEGQNGLGELAAWAGPLGAKHERVVLCGMGGSSLAPLVIGELHGSDRLHVLDSTDPDAVRAVPVEGSLFAIASKSGSTIEPNCFADAFWGKTGGDGSRFVAITDPGSALEERARADGWAHIAHGRPDVGGRYSALTAFGLVPAALAGIDVGPMLASASAALAKCHDDFGVNPAGTLATVIANAHAKGRDKLTFVLPPELASIGLWLEQLIAESTGKDGHGRPAGRRRAARRRRRPTATTASSCTCATARAIRTTARSTRCARPAIRSSRSSSTAPADLGALFVEWEIATALVGAKLRINPFDQPNVQEAKDRTVAILDGFARDGKLPAEEAGLARATCSRTPSAAARTSACRRSSPRRPSARPSSTACRAGCATPSAAP